MKGARRLGLAALLALRAAAAAAQDAPAAEPAKKPAWELTTSLFAYFPPEDRHYALPIVAASHGALHLEARYNYEGIGTGSAWAGWNLGAGETLRVEGTLMAGVLFGDTHGVAPGYEVTVSWKRLELYSEGEYVFDSRSSGDDFFYCWTQLGYSPLEGLAVGLIGQRTRAYQTSLDIQRGVWAGYTYKGATLNVFVLNLGWESPTIISSLSVSF